MPEFHTLSNQFEELAYTKPQALDAKLRRLSEVDINNLQPSDVGALAGDVKGMAELAIGILHHLGYQMGVGEHGEIMWRKVVIPEARLAEKREQRR